MAHGGNSIKEKPVGAEYGSKGMGPTAPVATEDTEGRGSMRDPSEGAASPGRKAQGPLIRQRRSFNGNCEMVAHSAICIKPNTVPAETCLRGSVAKLKIFLSPGKILLFWS